MHSKSCVSATTYQFYLTEELSAVLGPHSLPGSGSEPRPQTHFYAFTTLKMHLATTFSPTFRGEGLNP